MSKHKLEECKNFSDWDDFVKKSPQGTIFNYVDLIKCISENFKLFFVYKGQEVVGGISLILDSNNKPMLNIPYMQYLNCILFCDNSSLNHKRITNQFKISELIINELLKEFNQLQIINSINFRDLRPFLWYNYHNREGGVFNNEIRYTGIINLPGKEILHDNLRYDRRRDLKNNGNYKIVESDDIAILNYLHSKTFEKQNIERSALEKNLLFRIVKNSINKSFGRLSICYFDEKPASASHLIYDNNTCFHLFGANDPEYRKSKSYTKLIFENITWANKNNFQSFDFCGCNSPLRGDFKVSFNADVIPYYKSTLNF